MLHDIRIKMNEKLYLRNPEDSVLGRKIVSKGILLINKLGFEDFTFKKLAIEINATEATIYRYFENKHRLLVYLIAWYWSFLAFKVMFKLNNIDDPEIKLKTIIRLLVAEPEKSSYSEYIPEAEAYELVKRESSKAFLTKNVTKDNRNRLFKPYKDLSVKIAEIIKEFNPKYKHPNFLASTILEMSHAQKFFMEHLPSLTDTDSPDDKILILFLEDLMFKTISK